MVITSGLPLLICHSLNSLLLYNLSGIPVFLLYCSFCSDSIYFSYISQHPHRSLLQYQVHFWILSGCFSLYSAFLGGFSVSDSWSSSQFCIVCMHECERQALSKRTIITSQVVSRGQSWLKVLKHNPLCFAFHRLKRNCNSKRESVMSEHISKSQVWKGKLNID